MTQKPNPKKIRQIAHDIFGYDKFRPGQEAAIRAVIEGKDTLAVMPTGAGKSAIYQLAGLQIDGPTVVISPMIALQFDQVAAIEQQEVAKAAFVNSTISTAERKDAFEKLKEGELEFLFLAPEQLNREETIETLKNAKPSLFVVDEAHCISEWGHDFRPDYLKLGGVIEALGHPVILALTATAAPPVRAEIIERLGMYDAQVVVQGFDRPNIWLGVERYEEELSKKLALIERVKESEKPGIVYTATRRGAEELAEALSAGGVKASAYHAGMKSYEREEVQEAFMQDDCEVIVATTAFGMGIDKPNVRFVFHHDISDSVDSYYQEIGRAGRDGERAKAVLFYRLEDLGIRRFFASGGQVDLDQVERVARMVEIHGGAVDTTELKEESGLSQSKVFAALSRLEEVGAIIPMPDGEVALNMDLPDLNNAVEQAAHLQEQHGMFQKSRIEMIKGYAETHDCRRRYLLNYFGENLEGFCGNCDNDNDGAIRNPKTGEEPYPLNSKVCHKNWGEGFVMRYEGDKIVILFEKVGYKTLGLEIVQERGLLKQAS